MGKLYNLIKNFRNGDGNSFILILEKFEPQLNKFQRISKHEDMKSDLILFLFNLLNKIPFERECFKEDKYTISYISKSLRHHYIYLNKINCKISLKESVLEENYVESYDDCFNNIIFRDIIKNLTDPEKYVIIKNINIIIQMPKLQR